MIFPSALVLALMKSMVLVRKFGVRTAPMMALSTVSGPRGQVSDPYCGGKWEKKATPDEISTVFQRQQPGWEFAGADHGRENAFSSLRCSCHCERSVGDGGE